MNLYEINKGILECVDMETGEIIDEAMLDALQMARETKIENIALWIKNEEAKAEALKKEKESFDKRMKVCNNKVERLKKYLSHALNGEAFESTKCKISFRKSTSVEITDISAIPEKYLVYNEPKADKSGIKMALAEGTVVPGATLVENSNIQIK